MQTTNVYIHGETIVLNEKFVPGLVAGAIIYWCDEHQGYHVRDDHNEQRAINIVRQAEVCNTLPAWQDGMPLNPKA